MPDSWVLDYDTGTWEQLPNCITPAVRSSMIAVRARARTRARARARAIGLGLGLGLGL